MSSKKTEDLNIHVFNTITGINESRFYEDFNKAYIIQVRM